MSNSDTKTKTLQSYWNVNSQEVALLSAGGTITRFVAPEYHTQFEEYILSLSSMGFGTDQQVNVSCKRKGTNLYEVSIAR